MICYLDSHYVAVVLVITPENLTVKSPSMIVSFSSVGAFHSVTNPDAASFAPVASVEPSKTGNVNVIVSATDEYGGFVPATWRYVPDNVPGS